MATFRHLVRVRSWLCQLGNQANRGYNYQKTYQKLNWQIPRALDKDVHPPDRRKLNPVLKVPILDNSQRPYLYPQRPYDYRGPEMVHTELLYKQFGLQALEGGLMKFGHFEMIRQAINKEMDDQRMFACWRVNGPWKAKTKRAVGRTLGEGRGDPSFYVTPVRSDRIIIELGGVLNWMEAYKIIDKVAYKMPFPSRFVSLEMLEHEANYEKMVKEKNINPFTYEKCLKDNMQGCHTFVSPWHFHWGSQYR